MAKKSTRGRRTNAEVTKEIEEQNNAKINQSTDQLKEGAQDFSDKEKVDDFEDIKDQKENGETSDKETTEAEAAQGEEKDNERESVKAELKKLKAENSSKIVEVKTGTSKDGKIRPSHLKKETHTVYVAKKRGDTWGSVQTREMSALAYNAIAKDISLKVTLPKNSGLVEPEIKGCKDC